MSARADQSRLPLVLLAVPIGGLIALIVGAVCIALAFGGAGGCGSASAATGDVKGVPAKLIPIYQRAAAKYHLGPKGPAILAGINWEETGFGTNLGVSSAEAEGWMQFLPSSWEAFGVDGNGDGVKDPYNPWDAIFAAARLLRYGGAPENWHDAIYGYNHAEWYVADVLADAEKWAAIASTEATATCEVSAPNERVARMIAEADRLSAMRPETEYVWGGSHGLSPTPRNGPFDCSSAVSHILQVGGFGNETMTTLGFATWGKSGPGQWVTILNKPYEPEAHVILKFMPGVTPPDKRYWGTSGFVEPGHGPGWIPESIFDAGYLSRFELRHPPGF
ncbi:MAG TPA: lytic transglycosylase domain-containing protein [Solirubrobacterales bacterium]|nr:lytic transglycosylase domain-containing protein [Solirubrobacterales bacterium]